MYDLVIPATFSKRSPAYGRGGSALGRRNPDLVSKAEPMKPLAPQGPVKKSPVIARTGPKPPKGVLTVGSSRLATQVSKSAGPRTQTSEDARQRRLGALSGASAIGGGLQIGRARREIRGDTAARLKPKASPKRIVVPEGADIGTRTRGKIAEAARVVNASNAKRAAVVSPRAAGRLGAGAALIGASAGLMREHHKRRWN